MDELKELDRSKVIGNFILSMVLSVPMYLSIGYVSMKLWDWFIVPLGLIHISMVRMMGIWLLLQLLTISVNTNKGFTPENTSAIPLIVIVASWMSLLYGYILTLFI